MKKITVNLTVEQWNALHSVAVGAMESLSDSDLESGVFNDLESALRRLESARIRAAKEGNRG